MDSLPGICLVLYLMRGLLGVDGKWVEGRVDTKENWAFLSRFCFLSVEGQFEYLIEFDKDMGIPNLLLYYDDESQWPAVYHSSKSCKEREAVLNKAGQNQVLKLSYWYPETEYSGCIISRENKELPALKSTTTPPPPTTPNPYTTTTKPRNQSKNEHPQNPGYYDQFLKTTTNVPKTTISDNSSTWYEVVPTDELNLTTTGVPEDELWESIGPEKNGSQFENLSENDVELIFDSSNNRTHKIKRSTFALYEHYRRRSLIAETNQNDEHTKKTSNTERLIVTCHNSRRFRSARERWWFVAISNCGSNKGLDVRYKFLMTNGPDGDFWHEHFSADEFYVLPVLLAYMFAYVIVMIAVVMCSVELKSRHLLHSTYKLFLVSIVAQHSGVVLQCLAYIRYAVNGVGSENTKVVGQFLCGVSEMTFLLLLTLMAKGYTITRGRLKVGFTVKLTVFMCCYLVTYVVLFVYQAKIVEKSMTFLLLLTLMAKGYTITRGRLKVGFTVKLTVFMCCYLVTYVVLFVYQAKAFDPGEVLYLYESPAGFGLIVLRLIAWCVFAYSTFFTVKKYPEKNTFYCPFFICGTLWFHAGPLFILVANSYIDKWVRESVVTAVLLFITFSGHIMFLLLTLPVFANKNFPYHVRTTQIGIMAVDSAQSYGPNAYHPGGGAPQTVIIPLTRRTEELIGNMYSQYMATAPPISLGNETPKLNGLPKLIHSNPTRSLIQQEALLNTDTNTSEDIKPSLIKEEKEIFTVETQMARIEDETAKDMTKIAQDSDSSLQTEALSLPPESVEVSRSDLPSVLRSRRNILEPIRRDDVPSWSLAKGPSVVAMHKKNEDAQTSSNSSLPPINGHILNGNLPANGLPVINGLPVANGKKVPSVRNGLQPSSGEISTIMEGHVQSYENSVSKATIDLFSVGSKG